MLRREIDAIFGRTGDIDHQVAANPSILNDLPYATAVLMETMRLFPPVSGAREATVGYVA